MTLQIGTWAGIDDGCAMRYFICRDESVEIHFGGQFDGFDLDLSLEAARRLAAMMTEAVRGCDEQRAAALETKEENLSRPAR